jgi:ATP-dependent Clp protease ATP-binding subunit ClpA
VKESLQARFLPEFLNRIDETIVFHPLDKKHIHKIVKIQVDRLVEQAAKAGITSNARTGRSTRSPGWATTLCMVHGR